MTPVTEIANPAAEIQKLVAEYDANLAAIPSTKQAFEDATDAIRAACTIRGAFARSVWQSRSPSVYESDMKEALLRNAWQAAWNLLKMETIAPVSDKQRFEQSMAKPPEFTFENLKATFGKYIENPIEHILRGMAEIFVRLDSAYRSHSKVKVGVKGLPKRIIIPNMRYSRYNSSHRLGDLLTALQVFDGDGPTDKQIIWDIANEKLDKYRGLEFKWFQNGNLHVHFDEHACLQINRALAAYYGDVLPDVEEHPDKTRPSTALSKDLQYYPTPASTASRAVGGLWYRQKRVLEPSCGCGRLMDAAKDYFDPSAVITGIEVNPSRAREARMKGHHVYEINFLEMIPNPIYSAVIMNPPFYGRHYLKHIEHAFKFLNPDEDAQLMAILPATAHYDHKKLPAGYDWHDLPVGTFAESGTRVPTGYAIWTIRR